jgi:hypothetical protein
LANLQIAQFDLLLAAKTTLRVTDRITVSGFIFDTELIRDNWHYAVWIADKSLFLPDKSITLLPETVSLSQGDFEDIRRLPDWNVSASVKTRLFLLLPMDSRLFSSNHTILRPEDMTPVEFSLDNLDLSAYHIDFDGDVVSITEMQRS